MSTEILNSGGESLPLTTALLNPPLFSGSVPPPAGWAGLPLPLLFSFRVTGLKIYSKMIKYNILLNQEIYTVTVEQLFLKNRPEDLKGQIEIALPSRIKKLYKLLQKTISSFRYEALVLPPEELKELSIILIEFAEDLYCSLGFWKAYEDYNIEFFNTPLPIVLDPGEKVGSLFSSKRIQFLLHHVYEKMKPELLMKYSHSELIQLSEKVSAFLTGSFTNIPKTSGISKLLSGTNAEAGDVKRKLLWFGRNSYLFRLSFDEYMKENAGDEIEINTIDDFICAQNTTLSGLGVIDILANCLEITTEEKKDLRSWYERHQSAYKVIKAEETEITIVNIVNNQEYIINTGEFTSQFKESNVVLGSLIPWNKEWYWSGNQSKYKTLPNEAIEDIKRDYLNKPSIIYRYCKDRLRKAVEMNKVQFERFTDYYNDDIAIFSDGLSMAAAEQKRSESIFKKYLSKKEQKEFLKKHNLKKGAPHYTYPEELINESEGIALFYNSDEGIEIAVFFDYILNAFKKRGKDLTDNETESIRGFVTAYNLSPNFVKRIIKGYGEESILKAFMIENDEKIAVDYLLRKYKGHFYRNRYPTLTVR